MLAGKLFALAAAVLALVACSPKPDHRVGYVAPSQVPTPPTSGVYNLQVDAGTFAWAVPTTNLPTPTVPNTFWGFDGGTQAWISPAASFPLGTGATVETTGVPAVINGASGLPMVSNGVSLAPSFQPLALNGSAVNNKLQYGNGGTGGLGAHGVVLSESSGSSAVSPGTASYPLVANGASSDPSYQILPTAGGGTGVASPTAFGVMLAEGASSIQTAQPNVTLGILVSGGSSTNPFFSANLSWVDSVSTMVLGNAPVPSTSPPTGADLYVNYGSLEARSQQGVVETLGASGTGTITSQHAQHYQKMAFWSTSSANQNVQFMTIAAPASGNAVVGGTVRVNGRTGNTADGPFVAWFSTTAIWNGSAWGGIPGTNLLSTMSSNSPGSLTITGSGSSLQIAYSNAFNTGSFPIAWQAFAEWDVN